jgi:hypothetical protein
MISLQRLDEIVHDPSQTHLSSFQGDLGPYPGHPSDNTTQRRGEAGIVASNPKGETTQTTTP